MSKPKYGSHYDDVDVLCPFYVASNRQKKTIVCEGAIKRTKTLLRFSRREDQVKYMETSCELHYKGCPYYDLAQKKYEEDGE
jgi:hypothetical protein